MRHPPLGALYIVEIRDGAGMVYVEAFREFKKALAFLPPSWARLITPTEIVVSPWAKTDGEWTRGS